MLRSALAWLLLAPALAAQLENPTLLAAKIPSRVPQSGAAALEHGGTAPAPALGLRRTAGLHMVGDELWGGADGYKVRFTADGFELTPALGRAAPRDYPSAFRLESIGRGEAAPDAPSAAGAPTHRGLRVEYDRGIAIERYDIGADAMEQSFVFDERPVGTGDLVVRGRLETDMTVTPHAGGLRFEVPGVGGFDLGKVTGVAGDGTRVEGSVRYAGGVVELSLPASFVDRAALPITLDPPIGNVFRVTGAGGSDDQAPFAAYDGTTDSYLVVWTTVVSATDIDVHGQRVTRSGALLGNLVLIEPSPAFEYEPQVANVDAQNVFVVVYTRDGDIIGRTVDAANGSLSISAVIAGGVGSFQHFGAVGGTIGPRSEVVCTWQSDGDVALQATRVEVSSLKRLSVPGPVHTFLAGLTQRATRPRISKSGGTASRYAIAYQRVNATTGDSDPCVIVVDRNGLPITNQFVLHTATDKGEQPEVDGDGTTWVVAWQNEFVSIDHDIMARSLTFVPGRPDLVPNSVVVIIEADRNNDEASPSVTWTGDSCLVGWMDQDIPGTANWSAKLRVLDLFACSNCESSAYRMVSPNNLNGPPFGCGTVAGGVVSDDALLVWESTSSAAAFNGDIVGQRFRSADGNVTSLGGGCGNGGTAHATCARSPNPTFAHRLRGSTASSPAAFVLSAGQGSLPCGPCNLIPTLGPALVAAVSTDGVGRVAIYYPIPAFSPLRGVPLFEQWVTVRQTSPACTLFSLDMSNALRVVVE